MKLQLLQLLQTTIIYNYYYYHYFIIIAIFDMHRRRRRKGMKNTTRCTHATGCRGRHRKPSETDRKRLRGRTTWTAAVTRACAKNLISPLPPSRDLPPLGFRARSSGEKHAEQWTSSWAGLRFKRFIPIIFYRLMISAAENEYRMRRISEEFTANSAGVNIYNIDNYFMVGSFDHINLLRSVRSVVEE